MGLRAALRSRLYRVVDEVVERRQAQQSADLLAAVRAELRAESDRTAGQIREEAARVIEEIRAVEVRDRRDTIAAAERAAVADTATFVQREMRMAKTFPHPHATLEYALSLAPTGGLALEFGVYSGTTLKIIARARDGEVYGFDSFEGLPENWRAGFDTGAFDVTTPPDVPGAELVVGWFDDTLPGFLGAHPGQVDFLHIDSDLYRSAATVLEHVGPRLGPDSVVVFDEFFNYSGWRDHEARAWQEYVATHDVPFRYEAYTHDHEQVVVRIG